MRQKRKYESYGIQCTVNDDILVISGVPWRALTKISYKIQKETLYGIQLQDHVFHLMGFEGYLKDQDKPYRYSNLGWFTSPYVAKMTKEWQIMRYMITNRDDIIGYEYDNEIGVMGPYGMTDQNPSLIIRPYKLYK